MERHIRLPFRLERLVIGGFYDRFTVSNYLYAALFESSPTSLELEIDTDDGAQALSANAFTAPTQPLDIKHLSLFVRSPVNGEEIEVLFSPLLERLPMLETIKTNLEDGANAFFMSNVPSYNNMTRIEMLASQSSVDLAQSYDYYAERDLIKCGRLRLECKNVALCLERRGTSSIRRSIEQSCRSRKVKLEWIPR